MMTAVLSAAKAADQYADGAGRVVPELLIPPATIGITKVADAPTRATLLPTRMPASCDDMIVPALERPPVKLPWQSGSRYGFVILLWLSIAMPPLMVPVKPLSMIAPVIVLALVSAMPFGLIVPVLLIVLVIVDC